MLLIYIYSLDIYILNNIEKVSLIMSMKKLTMISISIMELITSSPFAA